MPLETTELNQTAVLWPANGVDNYGEYKVDDPVQINVRWEEGQREALDSNGNPIGVDALVVVDQVIAVGSIMWEGLLEDVASPPVNLKQVVNFTAIPDLKGHEVRRTVLLIRYSNELPTLN